MVGRNLFVVLCGLWAAAAGTAALAQSRPAAKPETLVVVIAGASTGVAEGSDILMGASFAIEDINASGGLLGTKLRPLIADTMLDQGAIRSQARDLAAMGPAAIFGEGFSMAVLESSPVYARAGIVQITPTAINGKISQQGFGTLFRTVGLAEPQLTTALGFLHADLKARKIAVLTDASAAELDFFSNRLRAWGDADPLVKSIRVRSQRDFADVVESLKENRVDAVFLDLLGPEAGMIIRQARDHGFQGQFVGGSAIEETQFLDFAGSFAEGVVFFGSALPWDQPQFQAMAEKWQQQGTLPSIQVFATYAAVQVWAEAVRQAGSFEGRKVAEALHKGEFDSVIGKVSFDPKGDLLGPASGWTAYVWRGGEYAPWHPPQDPGSSRR